MKPLSARHRLVLRIVLSSIFALSAVAKLLKMTALYQVLETSKLFPEGALWPIAELVVALEILVVLLLLSKVFETPGAVISGSLGIGFLAFSAHRLIRDHNAPCHCFGDLIHLSPFQACTLDILIVAMSGLLLFAGRPRVSILKGENPTYLALCVALALPGGFGVHALHRTLKITSLSFPTASLLGRPEGLDRPGDRYTIVFFGDYQCPPCKGSYRLLHEIEQQSRRFGVSFANLPLQAIHPHAMRAACLAEEGRNVGRFWEVHDALYEAPTLDDRTIERIRARYRLRSDFDAPGRQPAKTVADDLEICRRLGFHSTPTLVVIDPSGDPWLTPSVKSAIEFIES